MLGKHPRRERPVLRLVMQVKTGVRAYCDAHKGTAIIFAFDWSGVRRKKGPSYLFQGIVLPDSGTGTYRGH